MSMAPFADPELVGGGHVPHTAEELCPVCWGPLAELLASASDSVLAQERASIKPRHWGLAARRERVPSSPHLPGQQQWRPKGTGRPTTSDSSSASSAVSSQACGLPLKNFIN